jgi:uridylate kinase
MKHIFGKTVVVSLGGSVIFPDHIDVPTLRAWRSLIEKYARHRRFIVVVGGGKLARRYQEAAGAVRRTTPAEGDWLGIYATRANAKLVQTVLGTLADPVIIDSRSKMRKLRKPVTIACGWTPGNSTDYIAAVLAEHYGVAEILNAGKPAFVYDKNPDAFKGAKAFTEITWEKYRTVIPNAWKPGASAPIDPVAARFCKRHGIAAIMIQGSGVKNIDNLLGGRDFRGTVVGSL